MIEKKPQSTGTSRRNDRFQQRGKLLTWACIAVGLAVYAFGEFMRHANGETWGSIFEFAFDRYFFTFLGSTAIPILLTAVLLHTVRKLPPSKEKRKLTWVVWSLYVYLFVWFVFTPLAFG